MSEVQMHLTNALFWIKVAGAALLVALVSLVVMFWPESS